MAAVVQLLQSSLLLPALDPDILEDSLRDHAGLSASVRSMEVAQSPTVLACCRVAGHTKEAKADEPAPIFRVIATLCRLKCKYSNNMIANDFQQKPPPSEVLM